jgi:lysophospholipid hydrolase
MFCIGATSLSFLIRARYLSTYKELRELPLGKPSALELHPDVNKAEEPSFHNYLDEFLQAIRVFGFLEKPVFHELARHLQTRRLIAGDTLSLGADKSFYCVVDGNVQVFAPPTTPSRNASETLREDEMEGIWDGDMNGYQLLNDVGSGGTLSSLFTILSLFTENIQLRWSDDGPSTPASLSPHPASSSRSHGNLLRKRRRFDSDVSHLDLGTKDEDSASKGSFRRKASITSTQSSISSSNSTVHGVDDKISSVHGASTAIDDLEQDWIPTTWSPPSEHSPGTPNGHSAARSSDYFDGSQTRPLRHKATSDPLQQGIIARATVDTTLAVIPAEAFRRLTQKFPKASAHIVQGQSSLLIS